MKTKSDSSRALILDKIKKAKETRKFNYQEPDWNKNIYKEIETSLEDCFAKEISEINGNCFLCNNEEEIFSKMKSLLAEKGIQRFFCRPTSDIVGKLEKYEIPFLSKEEDFLTMEAGVTYCEFLVAKTGSVMVSSASTSGRQMNIFPHIHFVLAKKSQIVPYISDALSKMKEKYGEILPSSITNITGPSRTADIEKTLILGAHGPKEIYVFLNCSE